MSNVREVEDLIIECFNGELLQGKIDQRAQQLEVHSCIGATSASTRWAGWRRRSASGTRRRRAARPLREKLEFYKAHIDLEGEPGAARREGRSGEGDRPRAARAGGYDDTMMDFDDGEDKARKAAQSKHAMGARKL